MGLPCACAWRRCWALRWSSGCVPSSSWRTTATSATGRAARARTTCIMRNRSVSDVLMIHFSDHTLTHLLTTHGYWAVLFFVAIESMGIPFPGETMLLAAAIYAGAHHGFHIPLVILAAAAGAILGDNLGFLIGHAGGYRLLRRYGHLVRLDEHKLKLGIYLFRRHGGKVVFFGRFVAVLRAWAAFLAGAGRMPWDRFLIFNAAGGILWAALYGFGGYILGNNINRLTGPVGIATVGLAILVIIIVFFALRRNQERLEAEAERMLPGLLPTGRPRAGTPE